MNNLKKEPQSKALENNENLTPGNTWLTGDDVIQLLKISKRTLQSYRDRRTLPFSQIGRKIYYKYSDIMEYLDAHHIYSTYQKGVQS